MTTVIGPWSNQDFKWFQYAGWLLIFKEFDIEHRITGDRNTFRVFRRGGYDWVTKYEFTRTHTSWIGASAFKNGVEWMINKSKMESEERVMILLEFTRKIPPGVEREMLEYLTYI